MKFVHENGGTESASDCYSLRLFRRSQSFILLAGIDKAAIGFTIAIVAVGVGIALYGDTNQSSSPAVQMTQDEMTQDEMTQDEMTQDEMTQDEMTQDEMTQDEMTQDDPQTHIVEMPLGTAVPGCEVTNECYIPMSLTINAGDAVEWVNADTAAHTVTSGTVTDGPSGEFDSSLILVNASYTFTFEESGMYDYFCLVHPWMVGTIQVN